MGVWVWVCVCVWGGVTRAQVRTVEVESGRREMEDLRRIASEGADSRCARVYGLLDACMGGWVWACSYGGLGFGRDVR